MHPDFSHKLAFSIAEVVQVTNLGRTSIYQAIRRGELVSRKAGRRTLILRAELDTWLGSLPAANAPSKALRNGEGVSDGPAG